MIVTLVSLASVVITVVICVVHGRSCQFCQVGFLVSLYALTFSHLSCFQTIGQVHLLARVLPQSLFYSIIKMSRRESRNPGIPGFPGSSSLSVSLSGQLLESTDLQRALLISIFLLQSTQGFWSPRTPQPNALYSGLGASLGGPPNGLHPTYGANQRKSPTFFPLKPMTSIMPVSKKGPSTQFMH